MASSLAGFFLSSVVSAAVFSFPAKTLYIHVQVILYALCVGGLHLIAVRLLPGYCAISSNIFSTSSFELE